MVLISKQLLNNILKKTYPAANMYFTQTDRSTDRQSLNQLYNILILVNLHLKLKTCQKKNLLTMRQKH